jgi:hypothetical protein
MRKRRTYKHKKRKNKRTYKKHRLYRKRREISIIPNAKSIPIFTAPEKKLPQAILINQTTNKQFGNIIPGLRELTK